VDEIVRAVRSSGAPGGPQPRLPGERGDVLAAERRRDGVPVTSDEMRGLEQLAGELALTPPAPSSAGAAARQDD
jgi:LDH2 family malate/lactate/ureidoglycolate dehydrogenase